jgi:L-2-hydroxyglutarate oxidase LhgO
MTADVETVVVGAGAVGLAIARALTMAGREVMVLEQHARIGTEVSARNSGVIHAGIYYPPESLKARLCVQGKRLLYRFLAEHGVGHRQYGKLLVANGPEQCAALVKYHANAERNGVEDLRWLDASAVRALEPEIHCEAALLSPSTGILDAPAYLLALQGEMESRGGQVVLQTPVTGLSQRSDGVFAVTTGGSNGTRITCNRLVLAAGLNGSALGSMFTYRPGYLVPVTRYARGHYFALKGRVPFGRLIYPMPDGVWLGIHVTLDMAGRARFGPDMHWIPAIDYRFDEAVAPAFYEAIRRYWPGLPDDALLPDSTGIRPKIYGPGEAAPDFAIHGEREHGIAGLVALYGIESPGLTSSLAIGAHVAAMINA